MKSKSTFTEKSDCLIIGSGVAGLSGAVYMGKKISVNIVTKSDLKESSSEKAQGGIACVTAARDSFSSHIADTLKAGDGLCREDIVREVVEDAPGRIDDLKKWGVEFTGGNSSPVLGREGGHSKRRILHHRDRTGEELIEKLCRKVKSKKSVKIFKNHTAVDINVKDGRCVGAYVLDNRTLKVKLFIAKVVIVATGGCGKAYLYTTNPDIATGDGISMARRAGCSIANMEFIQFHPTSLYSLKEKSFLITEAMRGEGAVLRNHSGRAFMKNYDKREDLAPRDIVARAIDREMKKEGVKHVYLDICGKKDPAFVKKRFPTIHSRLKSLGIDITKEYIPVVPSAHYSCGGICVDSSTRTSVKSLLVVGEAAHTGLHGANRLASNSLLEALVYARKAALEAQEQIDGLKYEDYPPWEYTGNKLPEEKVFIEQNWHSVRLLMWNYVGIVRSDYRLKEALKRLKVIEEEVSHYYWNYLITPSLVELRNLVDVARIIIKSAMKRKESRGLHYNIDHPQKSPKFKKDTVI